MNILLAEDLLKMISMEPNFVVTESRDQFDKQASLYAVSSIHRNGPSLPVLVEYSEGQPTDRVLDVATGTGNAAFALAPLVAEVIGLDVAEQMLGQARNRATKEQVKNVRFQVGDAENIPFKDGSFSLVIARHAPHHFRDADRFLHEVRRVLTPGGRFVMVDQISTSAEVQAWNDAFQRTRDNSHFRQRTVEEWQAMAGTAGLSWVRHTDVEYRMDFAWWVRQAGASEEAINWLKEHARTAPNAARESAHLEFEGEEVTTFTDHMMVVRMEPRHVPN